MKNPKVLAQFSDELAFTLAHALAECLASEKVESIVRSYVETEGCVNSTGAAKLLGVSADTFRRLAKKIPYVDWAERTQRYRLKDLIAFRDRHLVQPKGKYGVG